LIFVWVKIFGVAQVIQNEVFVTDLTGVIWLAFCASGVVGFFVTVEHSGELRLIFIVAEFDIAGI
jgi:hypothetical protein